jgi:1,4-dihydroxy-2-naphthoate octaprenyltransferase
MRLSSIELLQNHNRQRAKSRAGSSIEDEEEITYGTEKRQSKERKNRDRPGALALWLVAIRPQTLPASLSPVVVGSALAIADYGWNMVRLREAIAFWMFALFIQIGTNLHNDYADFIKGADTAERLGQARVTQKGWTSPREMATGATVALLAALLVGVRLMRRGGWPMFWVVLTSEFNAVAYTGGPFPLGLLHRRLGDFSIGYLGLGDLFVLLYFGFVAVGGTYYLASVERAMPLHVLGAAAPVGFMATAIIVVNNLRDRKTDVKAGKLTMAVRFGATFARMEYTVLVLGSFAALSARDATVLLSSPRPPAAEMWWRALPYLTLPLAVDRVRRIWTLDGRDLNPLLGSTAKLQLIFCLCFTAAIVLSSPASTSK